jgi:hypothetical protein
MKLLGLVSRKHAGLIAVVLTLATVASGLFRGQDAANAAFVAAPQRPAGIQPHPDSHPVPAIDGAQSPSEIPDDVALLLFYRAANPRRGDEARRVSRAYLRHMLFSEPRRFASQPSGDPGDISPAPLGAAEAERRAVVERALAVILAFQKTIANFDARISEAGNVIERTRIRDERRPVLEAFSRELANVLGTGGEQKITAALLKVKKGTRIFHPVASR